MIAFLLVVVAIGLFLALVRRQVRTENQRWRTLEQMPFEGLERLYHATMREQRRQDRNALIWLVVCVSLFVMCLIIG